MPPTSGRRAATLSGPLLPRDRRAVASRIPSATTRTCAAVSSSLHDYCPTRACVSRLSSSVNGAAAVPDSARGTRDRDAHRSRDSPSQTPGALPAAIRRSRSSIGVSIDATDVAERCPHFSGFSGSTTIERAMAGSAAVATPLTWVRRLVSTTRAIPCSPGDNSIALSSASMSLTVKRLHPQPSGSSSTMSRNGSLNETDRELHASPLSSTVPLSRSEKATTLRNPASRARDAGIGHDRSPHDRRTTRDERDPVNSSPSTTSGWDADSSGPSPRRWLSMHVAPR